MQTTGAPPDVPSSEVLTRDEIFARVRSTMTELFEVDATSIKGDTKLIEDLQLDSIDAIDLAARLEEITRSRLGEEALRSLRTVDDVVSLIHDAMTAANAQAAVAPGAPVAPRPPPEGPGE
jgi:acyl carrier protein